MKKLFAILMMLFVVSQTEAQIPTTGLIDHYSFDNTLLGTSGHVLATTGNFIEDREGNTNKAHTVISFAGDLGIPNLPVGNSSRTISFWYKSNSNQTHSLFNYGASSNHFGVVYVNSPAQILVSNGINDISVSSPYTGDWTHLAVTYNGSSTIIYINGVLATSSTNILFNTTANPQSRLGQSPFGGIFANYRIDDLLIYNRALTAQEITGIYSFCEAPINLTPLTDLNVCSGASVTLTVTGSDIFWFDSPTGTSAIASGNSFTTPAISSNTSYFVQSIGCIERIEIEV